MEKKTQKWDHSFTQLMEHHKTGQATKKSAELNAWEKQQRNLGKMVDTGLCNGYMIMDVTSAHHWHFLNLINFWQKNDVTDTEKKNWGMNEDLDSMLEVLDLHDMDIRKAEESAARYGVFEQDTSRLRLCEAIQNSIAMAKKEENDKKTKASKAPSDDIDDMECALAEKFHEENSPYKEISIDI